MTEGIGQPSPAGSSSARLGKYQLIRRLAVGGMAEIFLARVTGIEGFEKLVVLKRILPQYAEDARFIRMFVQEARLAATLHHVNIAQVYDIGRIAGAYFFTMEYIHGVDAREIFRKARGEARTIPLEHALGVVIHTAAGLHYAHEKAAPDGTPLGLVHRDVSPSNIVIGFDGGVKLVDFGIAKATDQRSETKTGSLKGKIAYMSPEQCNSEPLDRRSDVFALGIVLYELTTGVPAFVGGSELATLKMITEQDVYPPSSHVLEYPPALERIVLKALRRDKEARYQTAQALQNDLERFAFDHRVQVSSAGLARYVRKLFVDQVDGWPGETTTETDIAHADVDADVEDLTEEPARDVDPASDGLAVAESFATRPITAGSRRTTRPRLALALGVPLVAVASTAAWWAFQPPSPASLPTVTPPPPSGATAVPIPATIESADQPAAEAERGTIMVRIQNTKAARIELDGRVIVQSSDLGQADVSTGKHALVITAAGFQVFRTSVEVRAGRIVELPVRLLDAPGQRRRPSSPPRRPAPPAPARPVADGVVDPLAPKR